MFSFRKNMIMCIVNHVKKIQIFSLKARSFVHLNNQYFEQVVYDWHIISGYHSQLGILQGVQYLATSQHYPVIFFSCNKGIYKYKLVNSPPVNSNAFIHCRSLYWTLWENLIYTINLNNPSLIF